MPDEFCGDGIVNLDDQCDDGNTLASDCCLSGCRWPQPGHIGDLQNYSLSQDFSCGPLQTIFDRTAVTDGAGNTATVKCMFTGSLFPEFRIEFSGPDLGPIHVGRCPWEGGFNQGYAVFSPSPGANCITDIYWISIERGLEFGNPLLQDWHSYRYNVLTKDFDGVHCASADGPGGEDGDHECTPLANIPIPEGVTAPVVGVDPREAMVPDPFAKCDNNRDGICDSVDLHLAETAVGGCVGGSYNEPVDLDRSGCVSRADFENYRSAFPACLDGLDNDGDSLTDFPDDPGCRVPGDPFEAAVRDDAPVVALWIPTKSTRPGTTPEVDKLWKAFAPPFPLNTSRGIAKLIQPELSLDRFVLHDQVYSSANVPDPARAVVTYEFERPVTVDRVEVIQHANGVTEIEGFVGNSLAELFSIGSFVGPLGDVTGSAIFSEGQSYTFDLGNEVAGKIFRFIVRRTSLHNGYALYRAFLRNPAGGLIRAAELTECNDGIDNDFDGATDFPDDPTCSDELDDSESCAEVFCDGFESGNTLRWSMTVQ